MVFKKNTKTTHGETTMSENDLPDTPPNVSRDELADRIETIRSQTMLSDQQARMLAYKSYGMTMQQIADCHGLGKSTVREHIARAREKAHRGKETWETMETFGMVKNDS